MSRARAPAVKRDGASRPAAGDDLRDWMLIGIIVLAASLLTWLPLLV